MIIVFPHSATTAILAPDVWYGDTHPKGDGAQEAACLACLEKLRFQRLCVGVQVAVEQANQACEVALLLLQKPEEVREELLDVSQGPGPEGIEG